MFQSIENKNCRRLCHFNSKGETWTVKITSILWLAMWYIICTSRRVNVVFSHLVCGIPINWRSVQPSGDEYAMWSCAENPQIREEKFLVGFGYQPQNLTYLQPSYSDYFLAATIHSRNQMFNSPSKKSRVNVHEMAECIPTVIERLISLHGVHILPIIWQFGSHLASCSDMNISCPSCYWALSKDFHKSITKVNSFDYGLSMGSAPNWLRRWYQGMKRTVHWKWGFHARIVSADGTSADQQSSWAGLERHEDQTLFCSSICELAHILAINPKMQNIFVLLLWGFIHRLLHFYQ